MDKENFFCQNDIGAARCLCNNVVSHLLTGRYSSSTLRLLATRPRLPNTKRCINIFKLFSSILQAANILPSNWAILALGGHLPTAVGGCSRVESEPASSLPGQTLPMGAGESWALQGKPGGRKVAKSQNIELSIVDNSPDDNSMIGLRELDTGLVAGTKQDHCTG